LCLVLSLRVLAFIESTTTPTECRIWFWLLLEQSYQNAGTVEIRSDLCLWLRLNPLAWTWISSIKILRHDRREPTAVGNVSKTGQAP
jgi:hypothetical protein